MSYYTPKLARQPRKEIKKLKTKDKHLRLRFLNAIMEMLKDPLSGKPLQSPPFEHGDRSMRVGDYRIIYNPDSKKRILHILAIKHRSKSYK